MRNLEKYAHKLKHPRSYFAKIFKEHFEMSCHAFIQNPMPEITEEMIEEHTIYLQPKKPGGIFLFEKIV
jgi:hypothetical protein